MGIRRAKLTEAEALLPDWCFWRGSVFEKYAQRWCTRHLWRVRSTLDSQEEALQVCAEVWVRCRNKYAAANLEIPQFMALYKVALAREFHSLSRRDTLARAIIPLEDELLETGSVDFNLGPLSLRLEKASAELRSVLNLLMNAPAEVVEIALDSDLDEINNRRCLRLAGLPITHDIFAELRALLS